MGPIFSLLLFIFSFSVAHAYESLSYSGRLVNSNGSPVPGTANLTFDLAYSGSPGIIRCSQALNGVDLSHGVFHVKLNFPDCSPDILTIFSETPSGETVSIRVTDRTPDPDKIYSFQAVHSVPYAFIAKQLPKMNALDGQVLTWDESVKLWVPRTPAAPSGGTVTSVMGDQGLVSSTTAGNVTVGILDEGVTSVKIKDATIVDADISVTAEIEQSKIKNLTTDLAAKESLIGTGASTDYLDGTKAWNNFDQSVRNALLIGYTTGSATPVSATDNVMEAIGKLEGQITANDTAFDNAGQWDKDGSLLFYNSGNVGIGTATPSDKLEVVGDISVSNKLRFKNSATSYVELKAPVGAGAVTLTLPAALGTNGQVLTTDSSGNLSWLTPSTDSSQITDGSIVDADVSSSANIAQSKIAGLTTDLGNKEPTLTAGTSAQYFRGDKTWQTLNTDAVPEGTKLYFTEPKVLGTDLLGFSSGAGIITATDTVLSSIGKLDGNIAAVSSSQANYVLKAGDTMSGTLAMGSNKITDLADPTVATDAANKNYVDTQVSSVTVTPGGVDEDIQFNNAGALGGVAKFKYSSTLNSIFLGNKPTNTSDNYIYMNAGTSERSGIQMFTNTSGVSFTDGFDIAAVFGYAEINLKEAGYLMLKTSDQERMRITATGDIGINTATPGEKLDVTGNIALSGKLRLKSDTVNYIELKAPLSLASSRTFALPDTYGTSGNALLTDGAGNLSWGAVATTATSVGGDLSGTIGNAKIVSGAVGSEEIADLSIVNGDIANTTITYGKLDLLDGDVPQTKVNGLVTALSGKEPTIANPNDTTKYWRGDKSWQTLNTSVVPEGTNQYFTPARVQSSVLSSYAVGSAIPLTTTDTLIEGLGKLEAQIIANDTAFDNTGHWSKNSSNIYFNTGMVGIGTSTPIEPLQISVDEGLAAGEHWLFRTDRPTSGGIVIGYEADGTNYVSSKIRSSSNTNLVLGTTNNKDALVINDNGTANFKGKPITSYNPIMALQLGNHDWTDMTKLDSGSYVYSDADKGLKVTGSTWFTIKTRIPIDTKGIYRATVRVKKIDGTGTFYVGASSLDANFNDIKTDLANSFNYFAAQNYTVPAGTTYTASGTISGFNLTTESFTNKFDPGAKFFNLVIIANYNGSGDSIIESVEVYKEPTPEPWRAAVFENGWVDYGGGYSPPSYYKDSNGVVHLRGLVKNGTIGTCAFTLPEGYRPQYRRLLQAQTYPNVPNRVDILTTGCVNMTSGDPAWIALDELSFRVVP